MRKTSIPLASLVLLAGCAAPAAGGSSLADSRWRFTAIDGAAPVADDAHLEFHADRLGARVGCNGMGGAWRIDGGRLIAGPLISTQMYCEGRMEQERAVSALLSGGPTLSVAGDRMTLKSTAHSAELIRTPN